MCSLKILDELTCRDYPKKVREESHYLSWYGNYHGKRSGNYQRSQKTHIEPWSFNEVEFSFLPTLTGSAAVKGTTGLLDFPDPAVTGLIFAGLFSGQP